MRLTLSQYADILLSLSTDTRKVPKTADAFLAFVRSNRAMKKMPAILETFERMEEKRAGKMTLRVETASTPTSDEKRSIEECAGKWFPGMTLSFQYAVNRALLGGVRLLSEDTMIDASVRRRLRKLETALRA